MIMRQCTSNTEEEHFATPEGTANSNMGMFFPEVERALLLAAEVVESPLKRGKEISSKVSLLTCLLLLLLSLSCLKVSLDMAMTWKRGCQGYTLVEGSS